MGFQCRDLPHSKITIQLPGHCDDDDDDESQGMDPGSALLEEVIDSFWIFKALFGLEFGSVFVAFGSRVAMSFGFKSTSNFKMLTE
ncbi:hypothetical protein CK203_025121 [Vitis vinifera]|uniref:Uncharacterized protein n=1 Tax=Vitis vinifera TaxID=29760 RepID=A0A438JF84_VITVI|nr:hypothetical protein CK203_025121 [Vitis vinifera]